MAKKKKSDAEALVREYKELMKGIEAAQKEAARLHRKVLVALDEHRIGKVVRKIHSIEE